MAFSSSTIKIFAILTPAAIVNVCTRLHYILIVKEYQVTKTIEHSGRDRYNKEVRH
jgi:hypothetical protein